MSNLSNTYNKHSICLNVDEIFRKQLVHSYRLETYKYLINNINPLDRDYQKIFNGFYGIRLDQSWRDEYYKVFYHSIGLKNSFETILKSISKNNQYITPSFASKMLATIDPNQPIWDKYVLKNLGLTKEWEQNKTEDNAIIIYNKIVVWYKCFLKTNDAKKIIKLFNNTLNLNGEISNTKIIDYLLWSNRK